MVAFYPLAAVPYSLFTLSSFFAVKFLGLTEEPVPVLVFFNQYIVTSFAS